jgi:hypothetical protein
MYEQGISDWRVNSAEHAVGADRQLTLEECRQMVAEAQTAKWFCD